MQRSNRFQAALLTLAGAVATHPACAQTPAPPEPSASAWAMGTVVYRGQHKGRQSYVFNANFPTPGQPQNPGAAAAFGVDDAGTVTWLGQTEYQPTQALATVRRRFSTPRPPLTNEQAPRYVMVCSWPLDDQRKISGPISAGYAVRDDSRTTSSKDGTLQESITLHWVGIPAARVQAKFAKGDYCADVAHGKTSSAPHWLEDRQGD